MADKDREKGRADAKEKKDGDRKDKDHLDKKDRKDKEKPKDSKALSSPRGRDNHHDHYASDGKARKVDDLRLDGKDGKDGKDRKEKERRERERSPSRNDKDERRDKDDKKDFHSPRGRDKQRERSPSRRDEGKSKDRSPVRKEKERSPVRKEKERSPSRKDRSPARDKRVSSTSSSMRETTRADREKEEKRISSATKDKDTHKNKYGTMTDSRHVSKDRPALGSLHGTVSRTSGQTLASPTAEQKKLYRGSMQLPSDLSLTRNPAPLSPGSGSGSGKRFSVMPTSTSTSSASDKDRTRSSGKSLNLHASDNIAKTKPDEKAAPIRPVPSRDKEREKEDKERRERKEREERREREEREERERKLRKEKEEREKEERERQERKAREEREKREREEKERLERERKEREDRERREREERETKLREAQEDFERAERRAREDREIEEKRIAERDRRRSVQPSKTDGGMTPSTSNSSLSTLASSPVPTPTPMPNSSPMVPPKPSITIKLPVDRKSSTSDVAASVSQSGSGSKVIDLKKPAARAPASTRSPRLPKSPRARPATNEKPFTLSEDPSLDPRIRKRNMVLNEIIRTERDYIRDLAVMREVYELPLRQLNLKKDAPPQPGQPEQRLLSEEQIQPLFYNIEAILGFNKVLYEDLVREAEKSNGSVGSCFIKFADFLKMYAIYCSNHENASKLYEKLLQTNVQFTEWINNQKLTNAAVKGSGLESYLIKPVQRLCRYPLLLKELVKETDPNHPDHAKLSTALEKIQAVINKVNEFKRKFEGEVNVLEVQKRIIGCPALVAPNRRLLKEGHLRALCGADEGKVKDSQLFMFNDLLVVSRLKQRKQGMIAPVSMTVSSSMDNLLNLGKQAPAAPSAIKPAVPGGSTGFYYKYKEMMPLAVILLTDRKDGATKNAFEIFSKKLGGGESKHVFFTFKKEDKDEWMKAILQQAADALNNEEEEEEEEESERPDEWSESSKGEGSKKETTPTASPAKVLATKEADIPAPWEKHCDPDGNIYYWNPDTDDSVWLLAEISRAPLVPAKGN